MSQEQYGEAFRQGYPLTLRFLLSRGAAADIAEEMAQAAWVKGWECRAQLQRPHMIGAWVNSIANMFEEPATQRTAFGSADRGIAGGWHDGDVGGYEGDSQSLRRTGFGDSAQLLCGRLYHRRDCDEGGIDAGGGSGAHAAVTECTADAVDGCEGSGVTLRSPLNNLTEPRAQAIARAALFATGSLHNRYGSFQGTFQFPQVVADLLAWFFSPQLSDQRAGHTGGRVVLQDDLNASVIGAHRMKVHRAGVIDLRTGERAPGDQAVLHIIDNLGIPFEFVAGGPGDGPIGK